MRVVAALIRDPDDPKRFLIQQRRAGGRRGSLWEFPGGKVGLGESAPDALKRECWEELAVQVEPGFSYWATRHVYPDAEVSIEFFEATILPGQPEPKPLVAQQLRYADAAEMKTLSFCEADIPLIERLTRD